MIVLSILELETLQTCVVLMVDGVEILQMIKSQNITFLHLAGQLKKETRPKSLIDAILTCF